MFPMAGDLPATPRLQDLTGSFPNLKAVPPKRTWFYG